jgi:hypothetical protein
MAWTLDAPTMTQVERALAGDPASASLPDALARRLGVESWMLTVGEDGRWRALTVLEARVMRPASAAPPPPVAADPLERRFGLPPGGVLARLVGADAATGRQLVDLALHQDDADVRGEAVRVGVAAAVADPALERALLERLEGVDDRMLAIALSSIAGDGAAGIAALVADGARGRPLGARAAAVRALLAR